MDMETSSVLTWKPV